ncbi:hypothetical protein [Guptibacillus algicola]|uniref:hypothetical protein n=1 Tax=Guptibacillus algicola TaxID=225844 RepID=UPI001CD7F7C7|nr:hypothetical protein [Alkalihalobacillus algicola]MCA0989105.1 hypothetical protein [Alkalihalobacillus algicola]
MTENKKRSKQDIKMNTSLNPDMVFDSVSGHSLNQRFTSEQGNELISNKEIRQQKNQ